SARTVLPRSTSYFYLSTLIRRPLTSPLFPYTTLFRSSRGHLVLSVPGRIGSFEHPLFLRGMSRGRSSARSVGGTATGAPSSLEIDRKSTRLNSSHGSISYAVFCLKKKKKNRATAQSHE